MEKRNKSNNDTVHKRITNYQTEVSDSVFTSNPQQNSPMQMDYLKRIPLRSLHSPKFNVRKEAISLNSDFVESIKTQGLLQPLRVIKDPSSSDYLVLHGNRRLAALKSIHGNNSDQPIPCYVGWNNSLDSDGLIKHVVSMAHENMQREDLSHKDLYDMINTLQHYSKETNKRIFTTEELAKMLCVGNSTIRKIQSYGQLDEQEKSYADNLTKSASIEFSLADKDTKKDVIDKSVTSSLQIKNMKKAKKTGRDEDSTNKVISTKHNTFKLSRDNYAVTIITKSDISIKDCLKEAISKINDFVTI